MPNVLQINNFRKAGSQNLLPTCPAHFFNMKKEVKPDDKAESKPAKDIGLRIKQWRKFLGYEEQEPFAESLGLHKSVLKKYESGYNIPGGKILTAFASTGVNINWLLTGEGPMQAQLNNLNADDDLEIEIPAEFEQYFHDLFDVLLKLDENKRDIVLNELLVRAQERARIDEMERALKELRDQHK